jgi:threonine/homoserine/homoserine lactone efflux protein
MSVSIEFLITTLIIVATPGTGAIFTLAAGLTRGPRAAVLAAFACTLGILPHLIAAITGLAAILHASAVAFQGIKILGVAYLLYMAWETWRDKGALAVEEDASPQSAMQVIRSGIVVNLLNPKLTIFFVAFLPQFVTPGSANGTLRMLELSGVFMAVTFVVFAFYGLIAGVMRDKVISRPRVMLWMRRIFAGSFVALGARLATVTR